MSEPKIAFLNPRKVNARALLASVAEEDDLEAVVMVVRRNGRWQGCWSSGTSYGDLCMALVKLQHDVTLQIHEDDGDGDDSTPDGDGEGNAA